MSAHLDDALSAYLDDELAPAARREAEAHLAACAACRLELDEVSAVRTAVRALPVHSCPPGLWDEVIEQVVPRPGRRAVWAAVAAAAAVIALLLPREPGVAPALPALVDSHAARASVTGDPLTQLAPIAVPVGFER